MYFSHFDYGGTAMQMEILENNMTLACAGFHGTGVLNDEIT